MGQTDEKLNFDGMNINPSVILATPLELSYSNISNMYFFLNIWHHKPTVRYPILKHNNNFIIFFAYYSRILNVLPISSLI